MPAREIIETLTGLPKVFGRLPSFNSAKERASHGLELQRALDSGLFVAQLAFEVRTPGSRVGPGYRYMIIARSNQEALKVAENISSDWVLHRPFTLQPVTSEDIQKDFPPLLEPADPGWSD